MLLETCSKFFQISKLIRHIEIPGIVRTVYSGIFRHTLGHSAIFSYVQVYWGRLRHIEVYAGILSRHIESYLDIFRPLWNSCMYKRTIFRTLAYLEPEASSTCILNESSEACQTCKTTRHIQNSLFKHFWGSLGKFRDIDGYSATLKHYSFCKILHLKCLTVLWIRLCLDNY